jgi:hypothetical protein
MIVHDSRNRPVALGRRIGGGGEGDVFALTGRSGVVAKIYARPTREAGEKLARMIDNPPGGTEGAGGHVNLAWPSALLYGAGSRALPVGFLMPHVAGAVPLLEVFNPRLRARTLPDFDRRYLFRTARNLAAVLATLHQAGYVVGDINESNILVGPSALVSFIDCDSFQVQAIRSGRVVTYPCPVGKLEYTAPELQGKVFGREVRHQEADRFGLGVLVFQLLMEGRHPFAGTWTGSGEPPSVEEKIRRGCFPYADMPTCPIAPPPNAPALATLPQGVAALMRRCFIDGHRQPSRRPVPEAWRDALADGERSAGAMVRNGRTVHPTPELAAGHTDARPSDVEGTPRRRPRTAVRRVKGANSVATAPQRNVAREAVAALLAIAAIVGALAGGSWLLQRQGFPFARPAATAPINGGGPRLAANTPPPPGNGNAAVAGACTPATAAAAARRAASAPRSTYVPLPGSWVAPAPDLRIRFFGMPWWDDLPAPSDGTRYSVGTVPDGADDRLDIIRVPGGVPVTAAVWQGEYDAYTHQSSGGLSGPLNPATVASAAVAGRPRLRQVAGYDGYIGQFHFTEDNGTRLDATLWVGQVGCDRVVMVFAGLPTRDRQIDQAVAQVLATIDFNAR